MERRKSGLMVLVVCAISLVIGCAKPPEQKFAAAREALGAAKAAEADQYAPVEFASAQALFDEAVKKTGVEKRKLFFSRNYEEVASILDEAAEAARKAVQSADAEKERMRQEAEAKKATEDQKKKKAPRAIKKRK